MSSIVEDLLYCPLDIENPPNDLTEYLNGLKHESLYQDDYRNCYHVPIMYDKVKGNFYWMPWSLKVPQLREWCEEVLFPITGKSRIMIITTPKGHENPAHIDCSPELFNTTLQHKFRYVLQGNIEDLEFLGAEGSLSPKPIDKPFIMSGKWPHKMKNTSENTKFTLALGSPWDGNLDDENYVNLLEKSYKKYKNYYLKNTLTLQNDYESLFEQESVYRKKADKFLGK